MPHRKKCLLQRMPPGYFVTRKKWLLICILYVFQTLVLNGSTGQSVLEPHIKDAVGGQTSPLTVSMEGFGNDLFLYFTSDCLGFEGQEGQFSFVEGLSSDSILVVLNFTCKHWLPFRQEKNVNYSSSVWLVILVQLLL